MTRDEVKEKLEALLNELPGDKAQLLLDFAAFLKQLVPPSGPPELTDWERQLVTAEDYWFGLPEEVRRSYSGKIVAVLPDKIVAADQDRAALRRKVKALYPDRAVLYVSPDEERHQPLVIRSPRLR